MLHISSRIREPAVNVIVLYFIEVKDSSRDQIVPVDIQRNNAETIPLITVEKVDPPQVTNNTNTDTGLKYSFLML